MEDEQLIHTEKVELQFKSQEERDDFIKDYSKNCWWLATYLDASIPHII